MTQSLFMNGQWKVGNGERFESLDPSNGETLWQGAAANTSDVNTAFAAAKTAFKSWSKTPLQTRLDIALKFKEIVTARKDEIGKLIAQETGKQLWDATGEASILGAKVDVSIKSYHERTGARDFETGFGHGRLTHRPHGVMAVLGPYNFPAHLPNGQIIPSLIAGNTVVFKPSEQTPATGAALMQAYADAGFPDGVVNLVQGARDTGAAVLGNADLNGLLFTGSAKTGAFIHKHFGGRPEIVLALEMGGNNPLVVWDANDAQAAASIIVQSAFITSGQRCTCARRLIVPEGKAGDAVIEAVATMIDQITIGAWNEEAAFMGPLISADIAGHVVKSASALPGNVIRQGEITAQGDAFITPHFVEVTGHDIPDEEIFGPVLQVRKVENFEAALAAANNTRFGLAAGLISDDAALWEHFTQGIHAGVVNFNRPTTGASGALPFGGPGASGNHNPGAYYAADFCAWPMASQVSQSLEFVESRGISK